MESPARPPPERATARYAFKPLRAHQLELRANDNLEVWVTDESWWLARNARSGEEGRVPSGHVQLGAWNEDESDADMADDAPTARAMAPSPDDDEATARAMAPSQDDDEATARARQNLHNALKQPSQQDVTHSQPTNLQGDRCKLCGSLKASQSLAETPGAFAASRDAREALIDDDKKCPECGAVKADAVLLPPPPRPRKFELKHTQCEYDSIKEMLEELRARRPRVASAEALRTHVYVGNVNAHHSLIQHGTKLSMVNHLLLSRELFAQLALRQFGEVDFLEFDPSYPVTELIAAHLEACEEDTIEDAQVAAQDALEKLKAKASMLKEYFGIGIDDEGMLTHLPVLLEGHTPYPAAIPGFLWRLAMETEWRYERRCFEDVIGHLGVCYAQLPSHEIVKDDFRELVLEDDAKETLEKVIFPALKQLLLPPAGLDDDACIDTLTTLERLYRQFERC